MNIKEYSNTISRVLNTFLNRPLIVFCMMATSTPLNLFLYSTRALSSLARIISAGGNWISSSSRRAYENWVKVSSVKWLYALHVAQPHFSCCKKTTRADAPTTTTAAVSDTNEGQSPHTPRSQRRAPPHTPRCFSYIVVVQPAGLTALPVISWCTNNLGA